MCPSQVGAFCLMGCQRTLIVFLPTNGLSEEKRKKPLKGDVSAGHYEDSAVGIICQGEGSQADIDELVTTWFVPKIV